MIEFDPRSPEFRANPYPVYELLREFAPIFYSAQWKRWFISSYEDCLTLLRDDRIRHNDMVLEGDAAKSSLFRMQVNWMLFKNPPDHTRLRGLAHKAFTPRTVERLRDKSQEITDRLIDQIVEHRAQGAETAELIHEFAYPLPVTIIAEMLGVPEEDHELFQRCSYPIARSIDLTDKPEVYEQGEAAAAEFTDYIQHLVKKRRVAPQDDLLSALIAAEEAGERLNEIELYSTCALLLIAGHETTVNLIGNGIFSLLRHPGQRQCLQENPALIKVAVEELLRYDGPVQMTSRFAQEDIEYKGFTFQKGFEIDFLFGAANRDSAQFENPGQLDITRDPNRHIAFGNGIHYCIGAPLARLEGQVAINTLLRRLPDLTLAVDQPPYRDNYVLRGLESLPVQF